jgi:hypothetical protein
LGVGVQDVPNVQGAREWVQAKSNRNGLIGANGWGGGGVGGISSGGGHNGVSSNSNGVPSGNSVVSGGSGGVAVVEADRCRANWKSVAAISDGNTEGAWGGRWHGLAITEMSVVARNWLSTVVQ